MKRYGYPGNILSKMKWNELMHDSLDYATASEGDAPGLEILMRKLTERERMVLALHYKDRHSVRQLCEEFHVNERVIRGILRKGIKKLSAPDDAACPRMGYGEFLEYAQEKSDAAEKRYCEGRGIRDAGHLYYQDIGALSLPARVGNPMRRADVSRVRELLVCICAGRRVRGFGQGSRQLAEAALAEAGLLPEGFSMDALSYYYSDAHCSWRVFEALNSQ